MEYKQVKRRDLKSEVLDILTVTNEYMSPSEIGFKMGYDNKQKATASVAYPLKKLYEMGKVIKRGTNSRNVKYKLK